MARILSRDRDKDPFNDDEVSIYCKVKKKQYFIRFNFFYTFTDKIAKFAINREVLQC